MCEDGWPLRAAEGAVDDVIAVELLPLVHGLTAAPAEVAVAVEGHEPFLVGDMKRAEAALGCRSLPAGHGVTRRLRSGGRAAASTWSWSVRPAVAARGVRPDLVERMVMLVSVADDDGVAVLAVAPGGHDCAGMPSAYDARAIAVLAPGNDYPDTDAGHASRHQWSGCRTVPVMRSSIEAVTARSASVMTSHMAPNSAMSFAPTRLAMARVMRTAARPKSPFSVTRSAFCPRRL